MSLRSQLKNNNVAVGTWLTIAAPALVEGLGNAGLNFIIIDLEHGEPGLEARLADLIRAAQIVGMDSLVRLPAWQLNLAGRILDTGAAGLVIPQVEEAETVIRAIQGSHFPPKGKRGLSVQTRSGRYGAIESGALVNSNQPVILAQIESRTGVENVAAIVSVPGLDGILLGPNDLALSLALSTTGTDLSLETAMTQIARSTLAQNLVLGNVCGDMTGVQRCLEQGVRLLVLSGGLLWRSYAEIVSELQVNGGK